MKSKHNKLIIYIIFLLATGSFAFELPNIVKNLTKNQLTEESNRIITSDDITELVKESPIYRQEYFNVNKPYDNVDVASGSMTVSVTNDLVVLQLTNAVHFTFSKDVNSPSSAKYITDAGGVETGYQYGYISLPNGNYYFYGYDYNTFKLQSRKGPVPISNSCTDENKYNQTGTFTVQRCYIKNSSNQVSPANNETVGTCASGYTRNVKSLVTNTCEGLSLPYNLKSRYCKVVAEIECTKQSGGGETPGGGGGGGGGTPTVAAATVSSLSLNGGSLSPTFKSGTYSYSMTVPSSQTSITVNATASGGSFVNGYGPRTVSLNYGGNVVQVKVINSANKVTTYTINVTRTDNRSTVNTLSNLTVSKGTLTPKFQSSINEYTVEVDNSVDKITIDGTLTDIKATFASDAGPGTYDLQDGPNKLYIKVQSESGSTNIYTLNIYKATTPSECTENYEDFGLLKNVILKSDINGVEVDQIEDFDPKIFNYKDIKLDYRITSVTAEAFAQDDADMENIEVEGGDDLQVNVASLITIKIKSAYCGNIENEYTIEVTRQEEKVKGSNAELDNLSIEGYDLEFKKEVLSYGIKLKKNDDKLKISWVPKEAKTECNEYGNQDLAVGSQIDIKCVSEDGEDLKVYNITIDGVEKGTNLFVIIIVIIIIILLLIYLLLRMMGYKLVFNSSAIGAFFRGIGEKVSNTFDK